ncbi:MAG: GNAT family N-acetyltransferase [Phototrophicaceae bacterium]
MSLSTFPNLNWRELQPTDRPAIIDMLAEAEGVDGGLVPSLPEGSNWAEHAWGGFNPQGQLVAYVWVDCQTHRVEVVRVFLNGRVHPRYRSQGVGTALLKWAEARAQALYADLHTSRPLVLRIDFTTGGEAVIELCETNGYQLVFAEDYFAYDLTQPLPPSTLADNLTLLAYSDALKERFYRTYFIAFETRPGFPHYDLATWYSAWIQGDEAFLPQLSFLATQAGDDLATILCHREGDAVYISQLGTPPSYRRQGIAGGLIVHAMQQARALGFEQMTLSVNVNNPEACHLYEVKLGFTREYRYYSYQKPV